MATATQTDKILTLPASRCWTREEFEQAWEKGIFKPDERLELIEGEIITKMVQDSLHSAGIGASQEAMLLAFPTGHWVRIQLPIAIGERNQPEPDVSVVVGSWRDYRAGHPTTAVLVIEVAESSLAYDRSAKAGLYAWAGIQEYWIANLIDRVLEVHRDPIPMTGRPLGHYYRSVTQYTETENITPLAAPNHTIAIADLLP